jgi:hypothetical protein
MQVLFGSVLFGLRTMESRPPDSSEEEPYLGQARCLSPTTEYCSWTNFPSFDFELSTVFASRWKRGA